MMLALKLFAAWLIVDAIFVCGRLRTRLVSRKMEERADAR